MIKLYSKKSFPKARTALFLIVTCFMVAFSARGTVNPVITSVVPAHAIPGATVHIYGSNFGATRGDNYVYFGGMWAVIDAASTDSLTVTVPVGAAYSAITVINNASGRSGTWAVPFVPEYTNGCFTPAAFHFKPEASLSTGGATSAPYVAATGDIDGDGYPDLIVAKSVNKVAVYRFIGVAGSLSAASYDTAVVFTTASGPTNVKLADLDGDGKVDVIVTCVTSGAVSIFRNTSTTGSISLAAATNFFGLNGANESTIADFDGDGRPDIAVAASGADSIEVLLNQITSIPSSSFLSTSFAAPVAFASGHTPVSLFSADFDHDGKMDIVASNYAGNSLSFFHNTSGSGSLSFDTGAITLALASGINPLEVQAADLDGDTYPEIFVSGSNSTYTTNVLSVLYNTSSSGTIGFGTHVDFTTGIAPTGLSAGDIDGDGKVDIVVSIAGTGTSAGSVSLFRNTSVLGSITSSSLTGMGSLTVGVLPAGVALADLDGDGKPDIVAANKSTGSLSLLRNYPIPSLSAITGSGALCVGTTSSFADSTTGGSWSLSNNTIATVSATSGVVTPVSVGVDTLMYTSVCSGDTAITTMVLTVSATPRTTIISGAANVCVGATITLTDTTSGGVWTTSDATTATISVAGVVTGLSAGPDTLLYTITNSCGTSVAKKAISVTALPVAGTISGPATVCIGSVAHLTSTVAGGLWMIPTASSSMAYVDTGGDVRGMSVGTVIVSYIVRNSCGADTALYTIAITTAPSAGVIGGITDICIGASGTLSSTDTGGVWSTTTPTVATIDAGTGRVTGISAGSAYFLYTITTACGTATAEYTVTVNPFPELSSSLTPPSICSNLPFTYTATSGTPGATFSWSRPVVAGITNAAASDTGRNINEALINNTNYVDSVTYVFVVNANGCTNIQDVKLMVKPNPTLSSGLNYSICSGHPFSYAATSNVSGTNFSWTRAAVTGITPGATSGTTAISETLVNTTTAPLPVVYIFVLDADGCSLFENVNVTVNPPAPVAPHIATTSPSWLCANSLYENFGAATLPPAGVSYYWSASGADIWARGNTKQYCLINFTSPGNTMIYLNASYPGSNCISKDSFEVIVGDTYTEPIAVTYAHDTFTATAGMYSYEWGYDDINSLDSTIIPGATGSTYVAAALDFSRNYYWVITEHLWCRQKTYYTVPTGVANVNELGIHTVELYPNPNTGVFKLNVESDYNEPAQVTVTNVVGAKVKELTTNTNEVTDVSLNDADGIYFVNITTAHGRYSGKIVVSK